MHWNEAFPKFALFKVFVQLWPRFSPRRRPKSKKLNVTRTKLYHSAFQNSKNQGPILSQIFRKNTITFCPILAVFWWKKRRGHTLRLEIKISLSLYWSRDSSCLEYAKGLVPPYACLKPFVAKCRYFKFQTTFSSLAAFLGNTPRFKK